MEFDDLWLRGSSVGFTEWVRWVPEPPFDPVPHIGLTMTLEGAFRMNYVALHSVLGEANDRWYSPYHINNEPRVMDTPLHRRYHGLPETPPNAEEELSWGLCQFVTLHEEALRLFMAEGGAFADVLGYQPPHWKGNQLAIPVDYLSVRQVKYDKARNSVVAVIQLGHYLHFSYACIMEPDDHGVLRFCLPEQILDPTVAAALLGAFEGSERLRETADRVYQSKNTFGDLGKCLEHEYRLGAITANNLRLPRFEPANI